MVSKGYGMLLETYHYTEKWDKVLSSALDSKNTLLIVFASANIEHIRTPLLELSNIFKNSIIIGASTAGEIYMDELFEDSFVVAVMQFQNTRLRNSICTLISADNSYDDGVDIANDLLSSDLKGVFILSDGLNANGSKLTEGLSSVIPNNIPITGGLAGDAERFEQTWILVDNKPMTGFVCAVGLYGSYIHMLHSSLIESNLHLDAYKNEAILSLLIGCFSRSTAPKKENLEAILNLMPPKAQQIGFYSYGEISSLAWEKCDLDNQTMTLTLIWESKI